jgi:hypothetical protein
MKQDFNPESCLSCDPVETSSVFFVSFVSLWLILLHTTVSGTTNGLR